MKTLPPVARRFLRYVRIDTRSDPDSTAVPSSEGQLDLARILLNELQEMGLPDASMDTYGYVTATLPPVSYDGSTVVALLAHMDTSPDEPGAHVRPLVHEAYEGGVIRLPGDPSVTLDPAQQPALLRHIGHDLITSDGSTLLGSDDKAGVAIIMQLAEDLLSDTAPRPPLKLCFTIDEEIGRGVDHLDLEQLGAHAAYTLDGSDVDTLSSETFHAAEATVSVRGVMVHPGYAKGVMVNALRIVSEIVAALPQAEAPETTSEREGYFHPHTLTGGEPTTCSVKILLRDFTEEGMARRKSTLTSIVEWMRLRYPGAGIGLEIRDQYRNMRRYIEERDRRVIDYAHEAARIMGFTLREESIRGGTDGSRLSERGLPTPNVFTGGFDFHSRFEWNTVQNLERALAFTRTLVGVWGSKG